MQVRLVRAIASLEMTDRHALKRGLGHLVTELGAQDAPAAMFFEAVR
jgi:hypothetical protein